MPKPNTLVYTAEELWLKWGNCLTGFEVLLPPYKIQNSCITDNTDSGFLNQEAAAGIDKRPCGGEGGDFRECLLCGFDSIFSTSYGFSLYSYFCFL